jgi:eukaryotic-like serine/threonine-protein kinase
MYEMLTGRLPFEASDTTELARMHREDPPTPPSQINPEIPSVLEKIILKILSKEPSSRYRSTDQLGRILVSFTNNTNPYNFPNLPPEVEAKPAPVMSSTRTTNLAQVSTQVSVAEAPRYQEPSTRPVPVNPNSPANFDWGTITLGLIALLAVGGLIPFWIFILGNLFSPH